MLYGAQFELAFGAYSIASLPSSKLQILYFVYLHWSLEHTQSQGCRAQSCRMAYCIVLNLLVCGAYSIVSVPSSWLQNDIILHWSLGHTQLQACRAQRAAEWSNALTFEWIAFILVNFCRTSSTAGTSWCLLGPGRIRKARVVFDRLCNFRRFP